MILSVDRDELRAKVGRERRLRRRVRRAAWRLRQAEIEHEWAIASARAEGLAVRAVATEAGRSPSRVQQIATAAAPLPELEAALAQLRQAGWPAPEDPAGSDDEELDGRDSIADRLVDEVRWVLECAGWVDRLAGDGFPPMVNLRPADDEDVCHVGVDLARVVAVLRRIAYDIDELARARAVADLDQAAIVGDRRAERRRRLAEPGLSYAAFNRRYRERARSEALRHRAPTPLTEADIWRAYQIELQERGEPHHDPWETNPFERR
jgi:hypothetical protein